MFFKGGGGGDVKQIFSSQPSSASVFFRWFVKYFFAAIRCALLIKSKRKTIFSLAKALQEFFFEQLKYSYLVEKKRKEQNKTTTTKNKVTKTNELTEKKTQIFP